MQAGIYHLLKSSLKECLKKGKICLMYSLKFSELKALVGGEVIARELSAPTPGIQLLVVSGEGCGELGVRLDTARNCSCWGWRSCSLRAQ